MHPHVPEGALCRCFAQKLPPCLHTVFVTSHYQQDHLFKSTCPQTSSQLCNCTNTYSLSINMDKTRKGRNCHYLQTVLHQHTKETHTWGDSDIALLHWTGEGFFVFNHCCSLKASEKCLLALDMTREHLASLHLCLV